MKKIGKFNLIEKIILVFFIVVFIIGLFLYLKYNGVFLKIQRYFLDDNNAFCTLSYPKLNIDIPCFWSSDAAQLQNYVDMENCAGIIGLDSIGSTKADSYIIAEHSTQEFGSLTESDIGDTVYVTFLDGEKVTYTVSDCFRGYNTKSDITHLDGTSIVKDSPDLTLYACMEDDYNIWIVLLQKAQ